MADCALHELSGCQVCSGKWSSYKPKKKASGKPRPVKAPKSRDLRIAEEVAAGLLCPDCLTPMVRIDPSMGRIPVGCACSRRALYELDVPDSRAWLIENEEEFILGDRDVAKAITGARKAITGLAFSTQTRAGRRAGLLHDELRGVDESADARRTILRQFEVDPTWQQPRRQEADHSPI